jgi:hypothetical protein
MEIVSFLGGDEIVRGSRLGCLMPAETVVRLSKTAEFGIDIRAFCQLANIGPPLLEDIFAVIAERFRA